jgi:hypothetical protein
MLHKDFPTTMTPSYHGSAMIGRVVRTMARTMPG